MTLRGPCGSSRCSEWTAALRPGQDQAVFLVQRMKGFGCQKLGPASQGLIRSSLVRVRNSRVVAFQEAKSGRSWESEVFAARLHDRWASLDVSVSFAQAELLLCTYRGVLARALHRRQNQHEQSCVPSWGD